MSVLKSLAGFLDEHCEVKSVATGAGKERCYVMGTEDCLYYMAEQHVQEMREVVDQTGDVIANARGKGDYSGIIMSYNWDAPEPGMNSIRIPVKLVESLDDKRAMMILRSLQGIQMDIDEGRRRREGVQALFDDTATVKSSTNLEGERIFIITSAASASDRRRYAERYAEHVATNVLFDLPKALNAKLEKTLPKEARGRYFVEGRDITARKIRFGADERIELVLSDEGAEVYAGLAKKDARTAEALRKVLRQAITDPFGFSLKYYMGKHAIIKLAGSKDEK